MNKRGMEKWGGTKSKGEKKMKERKMKKETTVSGNKLLNIFDFLYMCIANIGIGIESPKMFCSVIINRDLK